MGWPQFSCPLSLARSWWKPLKKVGYSVQLFEEGLIEFERGVYEDFTSTDDSGGMVRYGGMDALVSINQKHITADGALACMILPSADVSKSIQLMWEIARIMLASGAKINFVQDKCRRLYLCSADFIERWWEHFASFEVETKPAHLLLGDLNDIGIKKLHYVNGVVHYGGTSVNVFTGPAINPATEESIHYLAVGYEHDFLNFGRRNRLTKNLEGILLSRGAARINIQIDA